jgi:hypothetical protein
MIEVGEFGRRYRDLESDECYNCQSPAEREYTDASVVCVVFKCGSVHLFLSSSFVPNSSILMVPCGLFGDPLNADHPWPVHDILVRLAKAADHLLDVHCCDDHGYEEVKVAAEQARLCAARMKARQTLNTGETT